jgi:methylmalonyl-CoA epimerase
MTQIDHLGIAVKSLAQAKKFYETLGLEIMPEEIVEAEKVRVAMVPMGESRIELLEPTSPDSIVAKFLEKRGPGLHHVALQVTNLVERVEELKAAGTRLVNDEVQIGAGGRMYVFVHPSSTNGVLLELVEEVPIGV